MSTTSYKFNYLKREFTIRKRGDSWQADFGRASGRRIMRSFDTKAEAENWLKQQSLLLDQQGRDAFVMTDAQRIDAVRALGVLQNFGISLEDASRYYARHKAPTGGKKTISEVLDEYIQDATDRGLRPQSLKDLRIRLGKLKTMFGTRLITEIHQKEAEKWIKSIPLTPMSKRHYGVVAGGLWNYAIEKEYCSENPFARKSKRRGTVMQDQKLPEILTWREVQSVMFAANEKHPDMVPALAIGFFAGFRTSELLQLDWRNVDLTSSLITVLPETAKKRRARHVEIKDNLLKWLLPYKKESGLVAPQASQWRIGFDEVRHDAGLKRWPSNAMRHSFASYHLVKFGNMNTTALQLGHRDTGLLFDHYRGLVKPQDAEQYWVITPKVDSGIIQFSKVAG